MEKEEKKIWEKMTFCVVWLGEKREEKSGETQVFSSRVHQNTFFPNWGEIKRENGNTKVTIRFFFFSFFSSRILLLIYFGFSFSIYSFFSFFFHFCHFILLLLHFFLLVNQIIRFFLSSLLGFYFFYFLFFLKKCPSIHNFNENIICYFFYLIYLRDIWE